MVYQPTLADVVLLTQPTYFPKNKEITGSDLKKKKKKRIIGVKLKVDPPE